MSYVRIDLSDYIDEFDDADLAREMRSRGYGVYAPPALLAALNATDKSRHGVEVDNSPSFEDELRALRTCIVERRDDDALALLDRLLQPRFRNLEHCKDEYGKAKAT